MEDWSARLISDLSSADERARRVAGRLTADQLNWRARPESWSVGQCLEHLYKTNLVYLPAIAASLEGCRPAPVDEIRPGWFGRWFIRKFIEPSDRTGKARAPKKIEPPGHVDVSIVESFIGSNEEARALVRRASPLDVNRIRFRNPFIPLIRFTAGTGLLIVARHQVRHLLQAERVRESADFPA